MSVLRYHSWWYSGEHRWLVLNFSLAIYKTFSLLVVLLWWSYFLFVSCLCFSLTYYLLCFLTVNFMASVISDICDLKNTKSSVNVYYFLSYYCYYYSICSKVSHFYNFSFHYEKIRNFLLCFSFSSSILIFCWFNYRLKRQSSICWGLCKGLRCHPE